MWGKCCIPRSSILSRSLAVLLQNEAITGTDLLLSENGLDEGFEVNGEGCPGSTTNLIRVNLGCPGLMGVVVVYHFKQGMMQSLLTGCIRLMKLENQPV